MSTLKNLYFDLVPFAYHAAFYEGLKKELKKICQRMLESREYEKMLAIASEYAERIGSMEEALQLLGIKEELPELLERDWEQQTAIGSAVQPVYEDGALDGAEYACCMAMYACRSRHIPYDGDPLTEMGYENYAEAPYEIPQRF